MSQSANYQQDLTIFLLHFTRTEVQKLLDQLNGVDEPEVEQARDILIGLKEKIMFYEYCDYSIEKKIADLHKVKNFLRSIQRIKSSLNE